MQDRTPTPGQEGRALIAPEDGSQAYYAKISMADNPTQEGTPYDKLNVLQDVTCDAIGIPHTSTPNEAFLALALGIGKYGYVIHVQYPDGSPAEGFTLTGLNAPDGSAAVTNANGDAVGVSTEQSVTVGIDSPYIDIQDVSGQVVESTGILTEYTVTLEPISNYVTISNSSQIKLSPLVSTFDVCAVGGGGGGGGSPSSSGNKYGAGGGGGYVVNALGVQNKIGVPISVTIGSGGAGGVAPGTNGGPGGTTDVSFADGSGTIVSAAGRTFGRGAQGPQTIPTGNGNGGYNFSTGTGTVSATNGSGYRFNDPSSGVVGGGGGGFRHESGGTPFGGAGGDPNHSGSPGQGPGGGGGAGNNGYGAEPAKGGAGYQGIVYIRVHHAA